jgi:hypothetical protein
MAAGSQLENGIWALLVIAAIAINMICTKDMFVSHMSMINQ